MPIAPGSDDPQADLPIQPTPWPGLPSDPPPPPPEAPCESPSDSVGSLDLPVLRQQARRDRTDKDPDSVDASE